MKTLADRIRAKARKDDVGVEELRLRIKLGGGTFYGLLRGELPRTTRVIRKLEENGIRVRDLLTA